MNFYTKVLSKFSAERSLKLTLKVEVAPEGGYFVQIEDLAGCYSQGETVTEAVEMIEEARRLWLEVAYEEGLRDEEPPVAVQRQGLGPAQ